jgi:hypothetical protein
MITKWIHDVYFGWLDLIGRPDFPYTDQLRNIAKKRPWLFLIIGLPIFILWLIRLIYAKNKWGYVILGILVFIFTTWLMLHIGHYC